MDRFPNDRFVRVGVVGRAHGLRGSFFVSGRTTEVPISFFELRIGSEPSTAARTKILKTSMQGGRPLIKCDIAKDRTEAQTLTGLAIWVARENATGASTCDDLIGLTVVDLVNQTIGTVMRIYNVGASDILTVRNRDAEVDLPFVEEYIRKVDRQQGVIFLAVSGAAFAGLWTEVHDA